MAQLSILRIGIALLLLSSSLNISSAEQTPKTTHAPKRPTIAGNTPQDTEKTQLEGFGLAQKQFIQLAEVPPTIKNIAKKSMKKLCACVVSFSSCITVTAIREGGVFITNEHALQVLESSLVEMRKLFAEQRKKCIFDYGILNEDGKPKKVTWRTKKRGSYTPAKDAGHSKMWKPEKHYKMKTGEFEDHTMDLAVIEIGGLEATPPIELAGEYSKGMKVYHMGYAAGDGLNGDKERLNAIKSPIPQISSGEIQNIVGNNIEADFLGVNGTSGGPILNENGKLVGIFWGKERSPRESLFSFKLQEWLKINGYPRERALGIPLEHVQNFISDL